MRPSFRSERALHSLLRGSSAHYALARCGKHSIRAAYRAQHIGALIARQLAAGGTLLQTHNGAHPLPSRRWRCVDACAAQRSATPATPSRSTCRFCLRAKQAPLLPHRLAGALARQDIDGYLRMVKPAQSAPIAPCARLMGENIGICASARTA